jgi:tight adherence protein C
MSPTTLLAIAPLLCLGASIGRLAYLAAQRRPRPSDLGYRGLMRANARRTTLAFQLVEPWICSFGREIQRWRYAPLRTKLDRLLLQAGEPLGLCADELIALSLLSSGAGATCFILAAQVCGFSAGAPAVVGCVLGMIAPWTRVHAAAAQRALQFNRGLPAAIDLLSLCMSAGLDFSGALRLLLEERSVRHAALHEELERVTQALALGHTRREALLAFQERAPTPAVRDFVNAIVQAERSGTPLRTVLEIQARMLRLRRSVMAEEAAARAALLLLGPLCLLLCAIMLVMFGPFVVNGIGL